MLLALGLSNCGLGNRNAKGRELRVIGVLVRGHVCDCFKGRKHVRGSRDQISVCVGLLPRTNAGYYVPVGVYSQDSPTPAIHSVLAKVEVTNLPRSWCVLGHFAYLPIHTTPTANAHINTYTVASMRAQMVISSVIGVIVAIPPVLIARVRGGYE
jgi:hypothetical protein